MREAGCWRGQAIYEVLRDYCRQPVRSALPPRRTRAPPRIKPPPPPRRRIAVVTYPAPHAAFEKAAPLSAYAASMISLEISVRQRYLADYYELIWRHIDGGSGGARLCQRRYDIIYIPCY